MTTPLQQVSRFMASHFDEMPRPASMEMRGSLGPDFFPVAPAAPKVTAPVTYENVQPGDGTLPGRFAELLEAARARAAAAD